MEIILTLIVGLVAGYLVGKSRGEKQRGGLDNKHTPDVRD